MLNTLISWDIAALEFFRNLVNPEGHWQITLIRICSDIQPILLAGFLVFFWFFALFRGKRNEQQDMILLVFGVVFLISIYAIINQWFPVRPRPETISRIPPLINHLPDNSFPSGHAMFAGALALYCFAFLKRWVAIILFITGIIMVLSRIIVGVHYPLDIGVGYLLGMFLASLFLFLNKKYSFFRSWTQYFYFDWLFSPIQKYFRK